MTKTLNTKQAPGYTLEDGQYIPEHTLYRFTDENGEGGCWFSSPEQAEKSWERWVTGAPQRAKRRAEAQDLRERVEASQRAAGDESDPFARFDSTSARLNLSPRRGGDLA